MTDEYWTPEAEDHDVSFQAELDRLFWLETELKTAFGNAIQRGQFSTAIYLHMALVWINWFTETENHDDIAKAADILEQAGM